MLIHDFLNNDKFTELSTFILFMPVFAFLLFNVIKIFDEFVNSKNKSDVDDN